MNQDDLKNYWTTDQGGLNNGHVRDMQMLNREPDPQTDDSVFADGCEHDDLEEIGRRTLDNGVAVSLDSDRTMKISCESGIPPSVLRVLGLKKTADALEGKEAGKVQS